MSLVIVYEVDCPHCDEKATATTLDLSQPEDDGYVHIDVELSVSQHEFVCEGCGCSVYTGDIEVSVEDEECPAEEDEDDEDQDDEVTA